MSALIDIPFPEDCNHCLICSLVPELPKRELREKGIQYRLYCKVTGECVSGVGRGEDCPLHECKTGKLETQPTIEPERKQELSIEEVAYELGINNIQSAVYWNEFLIRFYECGFRAVRKTDGAEQE